MLGSGRVKLSSGQPSRAMHQFLQDVKRQRRRLVQLWKDVKEFARAFNIIALGAACKLSLCVQLQSAFECRIQLPGALAWLCRTLP